MTLLRLHVSHKDLLYDKLVQYVNQNVAESNILPVVRPAVQYCPAGALRGPTMVANTSVKQEYEKSRSSEPVGTSLHA